MNLSTFINKSARAVRQGRGLKAAADFYRNRLYTYGADYRAWQFDRRFGVNTRAKDLDLKNRDSLAEMIDSPNGEQLTSFGPADPMLMDGVLEALPIRYEDYTFIDLGSGTGRVLLMASEFPFRKIIGVEFCPPLRQRALENLRQYKSSSQQCRNFEVLFMDAQLFAIPDDTVVVFLSHPFREERLFQSVLDNLMRSLIATPRQVYLIYYIPTFSHTLQGCRFLERIHTQPYCDIYRNTLWTSTSAACAAASASASHDSRSARTLGLGALVTE